MNTHERIGRKSSRAATLRHISDMSAETPPHSSRSTVPRYPAPPCNHTRSHPRTLTPAPGSGLFSQPASSLARTQASKSCGRLYPVSASRVVIGFAASSARLVIGYRRLVNSSRMLSSLIPSIVGLIWSRLGDRLVPVVSSGPLAICPSTPTLTTSHSLVTGRDE